VNFHPAIRPIVKSPAPYSIICTLNEAQVLELHALYQGEWWTTGRTLEDVRTMLQHTDFVFGVIDSDSAKLLAFARVLTDRVYKAFLYDVIVHPDVRAAGLGTFLMQHIMEHPVLSKVRHFELYCLPERVPFYERHGFTCGIGKPLLMRRTRQAPIEGAA
jgi:GNAT superfamily N-acetyltransferase